MNKEQLAQTIINNYYELVKVIDPRIIDNDEILLEYIEVLQEKLKEERSKHVEPVQEEEELEEELEQTTEDSEVLGSAAAAVEEAEEALQTDNEVLANAPVEAVEEKKSTIQDKINKIKELFSLKRINIFGENIIKTVLQKRPKKEVEEVLEIDDDIDMDYVNQLAEHYVRTGKLVTLAPLSEKYSKAIGRRVQELKSSKEYIKEPTITPTIPTSYEEDEIFITTSTVPQTPTAYTPVPTVTITKTPNEDIFITTSPIYKPKQPVPRPTQTPLAPSAKPLTEEDLIYIDKAARLYLEQGYLATLGTGQPLFANEIINRAKEIAKEASKSEISDMLEDIDNVVENASSIKK